MMDLNHTVAYDRGRIMSELSVKEQCDMDLDFKGEARLQD